MSSAVLAVVPAAGQSRRFGAQKLLAQVAGEPLLDRTLHALLAVDIARVVIVGNGAIDLASVRPPIRRLRDPRVQLVVNPNPDRGMFSSIQAGVAAGVAAGRVDTPILVLPADMPFVGPGTIRLVLTALRSGDDAVIACYRGRRGHPVAIPARHLAFVRDADPQSSLRDVLAAAAARPLFVDTGDPGVLRDVDVPGDLDPAATQQFAADLSDNH